MLLKKNEHKKIFPSKIAKIISKIVITVKRPFFCPVKNCLRSLDCKEYFTDNDSFGRKYSFVSYTFKSMILYQSRAFCFRTLFYLVLFLSSLAKYDNCLNPVIYFKMQLIKFSDLQTIKKIRFVYLVGVVGLSMHFIVLYN